MIMGRKRTSGLFRRGDIWHVDKQVDGVRLRESTGVASLDEANKYLAKRVEDMRQARVYGIRPKRLFREAAEKYLKENAHKRSLRTDMVTWRILEPFISDLTLDAIHMGSLKPYLESRQGEGVKKRTVNHGLQLVRRILNLAATEWIDDHGLTWLLVAPKIKLLPIDDARSPYPLSWEEQDRLFELLPPHLRKMALFAANTGCRDHEICSLQWQWEYRMPELNTSVFLIPSAEVKNKLDRLVVLNKAAKEVVESVRGQHAEYVFTYYGHPVARMLNTGWLAARRKARLPRVRVHDLKHTWGSRLRAAGVNFEDRQELLGHKSSKITTHYSASEVGNLLAAANKVCRTVSSSVPTLALLKDNHPHKIPTWGKSGNGEIAVSP
jgi:integrase